MADNLTTTTRLPGTGLTSVDFQQLAEVPPAIAWFANIDNPQTRRAYQNDVQEFMAFAGIEDPRELRRGIPVFWRTRRKMPRRPEHTPA